MVKVILEMDGLTKKQTFFRFHLHSMKPHRNFYETKIVRFSAITTEWPYPKKHDWKRLSDFDKMKFYQRLYHCKSKRLNKKNKIKRFNWLILGNKCEIYLFTGSLVSWVECSPMVRETWVKSLRHTKDLKMVLDISLLNT